jgi:hypothetical protein
VRDTLKKVKLKNVKTNPDMAVRSGGGTLQLHCAYAPHTEGMYSDGEIRALLMKNL